MIFVDPGELKSNSKTLKLLQAQEISHVESPNLEAMTGADLLISSVGVPPQSKERIREYHLSAGAILVQIKHDADILSYDNAREAIKRMLDIASCAAQRMLLFVNNRQSENYYEAAMSVAAAWTDRGGSYAELQSAEWFGKWLSLKEKRIKKLQQEPSKSILVPPDSFTDTYIAGQSTEKLLQTIDIVKDFRIVFAAMKGVGPKFINEVYHNLIEWEIFPEFWIMLKVLTDEKDEQGNTDIINLGPKYWGDARRKALREWLAIPPGYNLTLVRQSDGDVIQPKKLNNLDRDFLTGVNIERMKEIVAGENK